MTVPLWLLGIAVGISGELDHHLDQARHFIRREWYDDAYEELEAALALPEGAESFESHWLAAQVAWELLEVRQARDHAARAAQLSTDEAASESARITAQNYDRSFGYLLVDAPYPGMVSRLQLESQTRLFDPELKQYLQRMAVRWHERTPLPVEAGFPVGSYLVNGQEVEVEAGQTTSLELPMSAVGARGLSLLQVTRLEIAAGVSTFSGPRVDHLYPAVQAQLAVTQPWRRLLLGLTLGHTQQSYREEVSETTWSSPSWSAGARTGTELFLGGPLAFRPSVTWRTATVPGLALDCIELTSGWSCSPTGEQMSAKLRAYATGTVQLVGTELLIEYREAGRTTAVGTGVKLSIERGFGTTPSSSSVQLVDEVGSTLDIQTLDDTWQTTTFRMLTHLALAF